MALKTLDHIPTSRAERTTSLLKTGAKIGVNYLKYYARKVTSDEETSREKLNEENAEDIYDTLKKLKGSALKVAQMLSMDRNVLPEAYVDKFSLSQFSVPPLSAALVRKTFRKYFGKNPEEIFDSFSADAVNAATIGQVHQATKGDKKLAVKIQYPGVRDSISSDLKMVKPVAMRMFNIKKEGSEKYFEEVEHKLLEETDYNLELKRSIEFSEVCSKIPNIRFPHYYPEFSCGKILTMDWMEGLHLSEFVKTNPPQEALNLVAQTLWDFYMFQLNGLHRLQADPHPGNFIVSSKNELLVIDFGCVKDIPDTFYGAYRELISGQTLDDPNQFNHLLYKLEFLSDADGQEGKDFFTEMLHEMFSLFTLPFRSEIFDFSNENLFEKMAVLGDHYSRERRAKKLNMNRGSKHFIYVQRTFFGLFNLMHLLKAEDIQINHYLQLENKVEG